MSPRFDKRRLRVYTCFTVEIGREYLIVKGHTMSNTLPIAIVDAAQSADNAAQALPPRNEAAVAKALDKLGRATWKAGKSARRLDGLLLDCIEAGATVDEASGMFRVASFAAYSEADTYEDAMNWAESECAKAGATAKKPNAHGQRTVDSEAIYNRVNVASHAARKFLGLQSERGAKAGGSGTGTSTAGRKRASEAAEQASEARHVGDFVIPFCSSPEEARMHALMLADYVRRFAAQNKKHIDGTSGLATLMFDFGSDVVTVCEPYNPQTQAK